MAETIELVKQLGKERSVLKGQLTKTINALNKSNPEDLDALLFYKAKLETLNARFQEVQRKLETEDESGVNQAAEGSLFEDPYETCYIEVTRLIRKLESITVTSSNISPSPSVGSQNGSSRDIIAHNALLSQIKIPQFDGNPDDWQSFRDTFESLVHNQSDLPAVQKFHLLKNALKGKVETIVKTLTATPENYIVAWNLLKKRCDIPRKIIQGHIKAFLDLPDITRDTPENMENLIGEAEMRVNALRELGQPVDQWNPILVYGVVRKLDRTTRRAWERTLENQDMPTFAQLTKFIEKQARGESESGSIPPRKPIVARTERPRQVHVAINDKTACPTCKGSHPLTTCETFINAAAPERLEVARRAKLCINCLRTGHQIAQCRSGLCRRCNKKHHTLLHFESPGSSKVPSPQTKGPEEVVTALSVQCKGEVLLGTAIVILFDKWKREHRCRVLLDSCSQSNFITERVARILQLPREKTNTHLSGIGQTSTDSTHLLRTTLKSTRSGFQSPIEFLILPTVSGEAPSEHLDRSVMNISPTLPLADPEFHKPRPIDALIGNVLFYRLLSVGQIRLPESQVTLQKTLLGWIVTGEVAISRSSVRHCHLAQLTQQIEKFWSIEEPDSEKGPAPHHECEHHFRETHSRDTSGRYQVRLPFSPDVAQLGDSYNIALRRLGMLERRLAKQPTVKSQYEDFLAEYLRLDHMTDVTTTDRRGTGCYLPHHAVFKHSAESPKIRVVFDASAKTSSGISLNDTLPVGPTIQEDLFNIVLRFRTYRYALTADIAKMYRQIRMDVADAEYQKILWRSSPVEPVRVYRLDTVTYGTATAPFLATRCLKQLAEDEGKQFPAASTVFLQDFYIDDLLTGTNELQEAQKLTQQLANLARAGGFELRQWATNEPQILTHLDTSDSPEELHFDAGAIRKTLGILWRPREDAFSYSRSIPEHRGAWTKRLILSKIAQVFDPLGLIGPVIIIGKLLMQDLWNVKSGWDEAVPQSIQHSWQRLASDLSTVDQIKIPRTVISGSLEQAEIHGFCDASMRAYGACLYLRSPSEVGFRVSLLCAKSRVAPLKTVSLPRLELCAAHLLTRLTKVVRAALRETGIPAYFWSDSSITLHWLRKSPHTLQTFVSNRVSQILQESEVQQWRHVRTKENPADLLSRGQIPTLLAENSLWWNGPTWLSQAREQWPIGAVPLLDSPLPEERAITALLVKQKTPEFFSRFSNFGRLQRVVAYCLRWRKPTERNRDQCSSRELTRATERIAVAVQGESFAQDLHDLHHHGRVANNSKIRSLNPFIDKNGLLRVGGRLKHAQITPDAKHPILLPGNHHVTRLIIREEHRRHGHTGTNGTLNAIRQTYWPINGRNAVRGCIHKCIICYKMRPKTAEYTMANLPSSRITLTRPFLHVGIDYCGPFLIKEKKLRNRGKIKTYVAVFVCFATKAIHLELVSDLSSEACLAAIRRFVGRRGYPSDIYSDNGTNFIGVRNQLKEWYDMLSSPHTTQKIKSELQASQVNWHWSPPRAPHFGGLWEAAVKAFKTHFYRIASNTLFTYEELNTCLIQIEAILNSRPITPLSADPNDLSALTPSHFLIGERLTSVADPDLTGLSTNRLSAWQQLQQIRQHFWTRWHREYLHELHTRSKWHTGTPSIAVGTMVLLKEDNLPPMRWKLGRVVTVHPGDGGVTRVVTVRTPTGSYKRGVKYLCPLPIEPTTEH